MGLLKDASDAVIKYSEMLVNRTEEYTKMAKLNLDLKKKKGSLQKVKEKIGDMVIVAMDANQNNLDLNVEELQKKYTDYQSLQNDINIITEQIKNIRKKKQDDTTAETGEKEN